MDSITLKKGNDLLDKQRALKIQVEAMRTVLQDKTIKALSFSTSKGASNSFFFTDESFIVKSTLELLLATKEKEYIEVSRQLETL